MKSSKNIKDALIGPRDHIFFFDIRHFSNINYGHFWSPSVFSSIGVDFLCKKQCRRGIFTSFYQNINHFEKNMNDFVKAQTGAFRWLVCVYTVWYYIVISRRSFVGCLRNGKYLLKSFYSAMNEYLRISFFLEKRNFLNSQ